MVRDLLDLRRVSCGLWCALVRRCGAGCVSLVRLSAAPMLGPPFSRVWWWSVVLACRHTKECRLWRSCWWRGWLGLVLAVVGWMGAGRGIHASRWRSRISLRRVWFAWAESAGNRHCPGVSGVLDAPETGGKAKRPGPGWWSWALVCAGLWLGGLIGWRLVLGWIVWHVFQQVPGLAVQQAA